VITLGLFIFSGVKLKTFSSQRMLGRWANTEEASMICYAIFLTKVAVQ
jgi:ribosomal protein L7Ae-like RNA K-turn-binding protein